MENKNLTVIRPAAIEGISYLRALAAFLVVWIHVCYTNQFLSINNLFTVCAVPSFILISVFLMGYNNKTSAQDVFRGFYQKILPQYAFWTMIYIALRAIKEAINHQVLVIDFGTIFLGGSAVQLWFLPALFIWQLLAVYLYKLNSYLILILVPVSIVLCELLLLKYTFEPGFCKLFVLYFPYVIFSLAIFNFFPFLKNINSFFFLGTVLFSLVGIYYCEYGDSICVFLTYLYSGSVFLFFLNGNFRKQQYVSFLSKISFSIYLIHFGVYQVLILTEKLVHIDNSGIFVTIINIIGTYMMSILISTLFNKNKYLVRVI